jgi:hypothetical protein
MPARAGIPVLAFFRAMSVHIFNLPSAAAHHAALIGF